MSETSPTGADGSAELQDADPDERGGGAEDGIDRINKKTFIRQVAKRAGVQINVTEQVYNAFVETVLDNIRHETQVNMTGFGRFYWQRHRGHLIQFAGPKAQKPDYNVLKFSATRMSNSYLDLSDEEAAGKPFPGTGFRQDKPKERTDGEAGE